MHIKDLEAFELSPGHHPHLMCFIPGVKVCVMHNFLQPFMA